MPNPSRSVAARIASLPHWARVAFAARCARAVLPLFQQAWPAAAPRRGQALQTATELAEQSAAEAAPAAAWERAAMEAVMTAGAALLPVYGKPLGEPAPVDEAACYVASYAAKVAESAATAAGAEPAESARAALDAFAFVRDIQVATGADDIGAMLERDLEALCRVAARRGWGDATPVPPSVFGRLSEGERGQGGSSGRDVAT